MGTVESGGQVSHIQIEHIWVEAAIDYHPSRGAINLAADSWVAMDPSYKQYEYLPGLDVVAISGIDPEQLASDTAATGTLNETEGWVSGLRLFPQLKGKHFAPRHAPSQKPEKKSDMDS